MLLVLIASAVACEGTDQAAVTEAVGLVHQSFQRMDAAAVRAGSTAARAQADCLDQAIDPATAAQLHGAVALADFLARDVVGARASLQAARRADADFALPPGLPPQHPLRKLEPVPPGEAVDLPEGDFLADGRVATSVPAGLPVVLQRTDGELRTAYLGAPVSLPDWARAPVAEPDDGHPWGLAIATGLLGAGAGAALLVAASAESRVNSHETAYQDLGAARNLADGASWTSIGLGAGAAGFALATVLTW